MATMIQIRTVVRPDGKIEVSAPGLVPGQRVTVSIEAENETPAEQRHVLVIVAHLPGHQLFQSAEEVDVYIREERDSWEC